MFSKVNKDNPVICWFSGGVTSAIACWVALCLFGKENCRFIFMDTQNEDGDTYRFMADCEKWFGVKFETITMIGREIKTKKRTITYTSIKDVWYKNLSLNVAHGAICSSILKRDLRKIWQEENNYSFQIFGYDIDEPKRAKSFTLNYPEASPLYTLLMHGWSKKMCIEKLNEVGIGIPLAYRLGFHNNNCLGTMCIQGGIGYWQKVQIDMPEKFDDMAIVEHELTDLKGKPVTMLKDQSKNGGLVFLKPHPDYPEVKDISMMKGRPPKPLTDCNGYCGINDLEKRNTTEDEINYEPKQ
jgi:hypothetical protein